MKIKEILSFDKLSLSFEVFPPKTTDVFDSVKTATEEIAKLSPSFMSVTYGAGGTTDKYTTDIATNILKNYNVTPIAHLTCVGAEKSKIKDKLSELKANGIKNILALRGDIPEGGVKCLDFSYANELVEYIKENGDFCIGGACYPDSHVESKNQQEDIFYLKKKVDSGCDFLTTQMFFDNNVLYNYLYKIREAGITVPVIPGIMPVTNAKQIKRICSLSGTYLPERFKRIADKFGDNPSAMQQAGIAYATDQIIDLYANGIKAVHVYSMNKPEVAKKIQENLSEILK